MTFYVQYDENTTCKAWCDVERTLVDHDYQTLYDSYEEAHEALQDAKQDFAIPENLSIAADPTSVEMAYVDQGYELPQGYTWALVHHGREKYDINPDFVPLAGVNGVCGWGVPYTEDGKPMAKTA